MDNVNVQTTQPIQESEEKKMMTIINEDGSSEEVEVVIAFEFKDNNKEYIIYTRNEKDENGNVTVEHLEVQN